MIEFGQTVKDKITGFKGIVTGRCEYITGCAQLLVQPPVTKDGSRVEPIWFDEPRLEVIFKNKISIKQPINKPGCDIAAPTK